MTRVFDSMLARSIPQYEAMRRAVFDLACRYVQPHRAIVDLGCSRGEALAPFVERFGALNQHVGVEVSPPMLAAARERFAGYTEAGVVRILDLDLRRTYPPVLACVTLSVLTIQFTPLDYRQEIIRQAFEHTIPGGAFLLVEKVLGDSCQIDRDLVEVYHAFKSASGYSADAIARKRLALEGVLVPLTARWNEELLRRAGFAHVDCFWRYLNFAGWIAVKAGG